MSCEPALRQMSRTTHDERRSNDAGCEEAEAHEPVCLILSRLLFSYQRTSLAISSKRPLMRTAPPLTEGLHQGASLPPGGSFSHSTILYATSSGSQYWTDVDSCPRSQEHSQLSDDHGRCCRRPCRLALRVSLRFGPWTVPPCIT